MQGPRDGDALRRDGDGVAGRSMRVHNIGSRMSLRAAAAQKQLTKRKCFGNLRTGNYLYSSCER